MTTEKERSARQRAFEFGQAAFREGRDKNPYPPQSPDHDQWEQGHQSEHDVHFK